jgi:hypothetical protein
LVNELVTSACCGPNGTSIALHQRAAILELVVPLNFCDAHGIVTENQVNVPNGFHLAITKLLEKFDATLLLESFRHFCGK